MTSSNRVNTLEESLKEARALASMYRDLIANGESREQRVEEEIAKLTDDLRWRRKARQEAPEALSRATATVDRLEAQRRANVTEGYSGPSQATLQRRAARVSDLQVQVLAMAAALRDHGLDPVELLRLVVRGERS